MTLIIAKAPPKENPRRVCLKSIRPSSNIKPSIMIAVRGPIRTAEGDTDLISAAMREDLRASQLSFHM
jgi:hypothetical protein